MRILIAAARLTRNMLAAVLPLMAVSGGAADEDRQRRDRQAGRLRELQRRRVGGHLGRRWRALLLLRRHGRLQPCLRQQLRLPQDQRRRPGPAPRPHGQPHVGLRQGLRLEKDGCCWKADGNLALDGVLYLWISRHQYGAAGHDPHRRQFASNASLIKSADHGKTWTRSAKENYEQPMFPGRHSAPLLHPLRQRRQGRRRRRRQVCLRGLQRRLLGQRQRHDSGDACPERRSATFHAADWEFFLGGDGLKDGAGRRTWRTPCRSCTTKASAR